MGMYRAAVVGSLALLLSTSVPLAAAQNLTAIASFNTAQGLVDGEVIFGQQDANSAAGTYAQIDTDDVITTDFPPTCGTGTSWPGATDGMVCAASSCTSRCDSECTNEDLFCNAGNHSWVLLNGRFREAYKAARKRTIDNHGPVFIAYSSHHLVWLHEGNTSTNATYLPEQFATLKSLAHVPLTLFVLLWQEGAPPLNETTRAAAKDLLTHLDQVAQNWGALNLTSDQVDRQQRMVNASQQFVKDVLKSGHFADTQQATAFTKSVRAAVYQNVRDAARGAVDGLHKQVQDWRKQMGEEAWERLRVVVVGAHMAQKGEMTVQYFLRALQQSSEYDRVAFAQYPCNADCALTVLGGHSLDMAVSRAFFDDPERMHRDVLGDATQDYLNELVF